MLRALPISLILLLAAGAGCQSKERVDLSRWVTLHPGASIIQLKGRTTSLPVLVRNVSPEKLTELSLEVKTSCCTVEVAPSSIPAISPGDRRIFAITLTRKDAGAEHRVPLFLTLRGTGLPVAAGMDLMVDLSRSASGTWMDVGQVKLIPRDDEKTVYYLLAGAPLLIVIGYMLWRWSRAPRRKEEE